MCAFNGSSPLRVDLMFYGSMWPWLASTRRSPTRPRSYVIHVPPSFRTHQDGAAHTCANIHAHNQNQFTQLVTQEQEQEANGSPPVFFISVVIVQNALCSCFLAFPVGSAREPAKPQLNRYELRGCKNQEIAGSIFHQRFDCPEFVLQLSSCIACRACP